MTFFFSHKHRPFKKMYKNTRNLLLRKKNQMCFKIQRSVCPFRNNLKMNVPI